MRFTKGEKKFIGIGLLIAFFFFLAGNWCQNCKMGNIMLAAYCNYCSEPLYQTNGDKPHNELPHEEAIVGKRKTVYEYYYEYDFFADGTCKGYYCGRNPDYEPCLHPQLYIAGSGDGIWYFDGDELVIEYSGKAENTTKGTCRYMYEFNDDYSQLKIAGLQSDALWFKVSQE